MQFEFENYEQIFKIKSKNTIIFEIRRFHYQEEKDPNLKTQTLSTNFKKV